MTERLKVARSFPVADAQAGLRHVFVRDMVVESCIGVHHRERDSKQRVRINLDLTVYEGDRPLEDHLANVVCYEEIVDGVRAISQDGHINLVETLAERLAAFCLTDRRVRAARVRVEKLDVFPFAASVGVEIERFSTQAPV
ncbi:MAG: dihydroneopterin aldolase [Pseudomonadota bacterium]